MADKTLTNCIVAFYSRLKTHPVLASMWLDHLEMHQHALLQLTMHAHTVEQLMGTGHFPDMDLGQIAAVISLLTPSPAQPVLLSPELTTPAKSLFHRKRLKTI